MKCVCENHHRSSAHLGLGGVIWLKGFGVACGFQCLKVDFTTLMVSNRTQELSGLLVWEVTALGACGVSCSTVYTGDNDKANEDEDKNEGEEEEDLY